MTSDSERIVDLYQRHADAWDRLRSPGSLFEKPWLDRFLALLDPGASILDVGCGAALPIGGYCIRSGYAVTGIDSSPQLLAMSRGRFPEQEWLLADMRTLDLGRRFDGIVAWDSFFHLCPADQRAMFPVFAQHAQPKTALMFTSGTRCGDVIARFEGEPLYHGGLDSSEYRALLEEYGFEVMAHAVEDPACGDHTIWLARSR